MSVQFYASEAAVVAVDVGTCSTKVLWTTVANSQRRLSLSFSSCVVDSNSDLFGVRNATSSPKVCEVETEDGQVLVGPDAMNIGDALPFPLLHDNGYGESQRFAIILGAIFFSGLSHVELLCIGATPEAAADGELPESLARRLTGRHRVGGRTIYVHRVRVVANPLAASTRIKWPRRDQLNGSGHHRMIIDAGFEALRWSLIRCDRQSIVESGKYARSGQHTALCSIAGQIQSEHPDRSALTVRSLECATRGTWCRREGQSLELLLPYVTRPRAIDNDNALDLAARIEEFIEYELYVIGGAANVILADLERIARPRPPIVVKRTAFAVVRGLLSMGLEDFSASSIRRASRREVSKEHMQLTSAPVSDDAYVNARSLQTPTIDATTGPPVRRRGRATKLQFDITVSGESHPELFAFLNNMSQRNRAAALLRMADLELLATRREQNQAQARTEGNTTS